jgi:acyl-CoA synthetase (NDP forming)
MMTQQGRALSGIEALFESRSIAIVGASDRPGSPGSRVMQILRNSGYDGVVTAINPRTPAFEGARSKPTLEACEPGSIDHVLVLTPASTVADVLRAAVRLGVGAVTVVSGGFDEGPDGCATAELFADIVGDSGMRVLGPNCLGVVNAHSGLVASPASAFMSGTIGGGAVSIVSQSGAVGAYLVGLLAEVGLGLRYFTSTGNEVDLKLGEIVMHCATDDATEVIVIYLEGLRDPGTFIDALIEARRRGKNVIVVKAGETEVGAEAVRSHTAALAGDDAVYDAAFSRLGAYRARSLNEAVRAVQSSIVPLRAPRRIRRTAVVTTSGGLGILAAEALILAGFDLPEVPPAAGERMREIQPFCTPGNPIDLGGSVPSERGAFLELLGLTVDALALDAIVVVVSNMPRSPVSWHAIRETVLAFAAGHDVTVAVVGALSSEDVELFGGLGLVTASDPVEVASDLAILDRVAALRDTQSLVALPAHVTAPRQVMSLEDLAAMRLLAERGVRFPHHLVVELGDGPLPDGLADIALPVAVKLLQDGVLHKAAAGNVVTGVRDRMLLHDQVAAFRASAEGPGCIIVQAMVDRAVAEIIVSARRDATFGPIYVIGTGGRHVEVMQDSVILLEPVSATDIGEALGRLRFLGDLGADAETLAQEVTGVVLALQRLLANEPLITEVEVNPVILRSETPHAVAVDAVVLIGSSVGA